MRWIILDRPYGRVAEAGSPPPAEAGDELSSLLDGAAPYLGDLALPQLLLATFEVQHGGPAHRHRAGVADDRRSRPAPDRDQLHSLPGQSPKPEARGQNPEKLPRPVERELLVVGGSDVKDHPGLVRRHDRHVRAGDGHGPDHGVLAGVLADDLLADGPAEGWIALRERDQVVLVHGAHDAGHQILERGLLAGGGEAELPRILDTLPGERERLTRGGEDDLRALLLPLGAEASREIVRQG